jgi:hypothetical protein
VHRQQGVEQALRALDCVYSGFTILFANADALSRSQGWLNLPFALGMLPRRTRKERVDRFLGASDSNANFPIGKALRFHVERSFFLPWGPVWFMAHSTIPIGARE